MNLIIEGNEAQHEYRISSQSVVFLSELTTPEDEILTQFLPIS